MNYEDEYDLNTDYEDRYDLSEADDLTKLEVMTKLGYVLTGRCPHLKHDRFIVRAIVFERCVRCKSVRALAPR